MLYLVALISALLVAFCGWQLLRERKRRIEWREDTALASEASFAQAVAS